MKKFRTDYASAESSNERLNEVRVLSELGDHHRITKLHLFDGEHIVMELSKNGELFDYAS